MVPAGVRGELTAQVGLADAAIFGGDYATARSLFDTGVALAQSAGSQYFEATMRIGLAEEAMMLVPREGDDVSAALLEAVETSGGLSREVPAALMYMTVGGPHRRDSLPRN